MICNVQVLINIWTWQFRHNVARATSNEEIIMTTKKPVEPTPSMRCIPPKSKELLGQSLQHAIDEATATNNTWLTMCQAINGAQSEAEAREWFKSIEEHKLYLEVNPKPIVDGEPPKRSKWASYKAKIIRGIKNDIKLLENPNKAVAVEALRKQCSEAEGNTPAEPTSNQADILKERPMVKILSTCSKADYNRLAKVIQAELDRMSPVKKVA